MEMLAANSGIIVFLMLGFGTFLACLACLACMAMACMTMAYAARGISANSTGISMGTSVDLDSLTPKYPFVIAAVLLIGFYFLIDASLG